MGLIDLIVVLIVVGVLLYLVQLIPMDATIKRIIVIVVILFVVLWLLQALGLFSAGRMRLGAITEGLTWLN